MKENSDPWANVKSALLLRFEVAAAFRLRKERPVTLQLGTPDGPSSATLSTEFAENGLPHTICRIEIITGAPDLNTGGATWLNRLGGIVNAIAVASNAAVGDVQPLYAIDVTNGRINRSFMQRETTLARPVVPKQTRLIEYEPVLEFAQCFFNDFESSDRLTRAIQQYVLALRYSTPESKIMQVAHAFMAAEALTPVARHHLQERLGLSDDDFYEDAKKDGDVKYSLRRNDKPNTKNHFARRRVVFGGDRETHQAARKVSDGFEHGFESYDKLLTMAEKCAEPTMAHIRRAIINLSPLADNHKAVLLDDERFRKPLAIYSGRFLTGTVSGVASGGNDEWNYPIDLAEQVVDVEYDVASGKYTYPLNLNLKSNRDGVEVTAHIDT